jgi:hypothetical protein
LCLPKDVRIFQEPENAPRDSRHCLRVDVIGLV